MLVTVSREDAARLLVEAVRDAVGRTGLVAERVCEAAEQLLGALTVAEGDEIVAALGDALGGAAVLAQAELDRWRRLCRQLHDRTLAGAGEQVAIIGRDLAVVCACAERQAETLEPAVRAQLLARVGRCRDALSAEDLRLGSLELDGPDTEVAANPV
jgi:hypothetical protein